MDWPSAPAHATCRIGLLWCRDIQNIDMVHNEKSHQLEAKHKTNRQCQGPGEDNLVWKLGDCGGLPKSPQDWRLCQGPHHNPMSKDPSPQLHQEMHKENEMASLWRNFHQQPPPKAEWLENDDIKLDDDNNYNCHYPYRYQHQQGNHQWSPSSSSLPLLILLIIIKIISATLFTRNLPWPHQSTITNFKPEQSRTPLTEPRPVD